MAGALIFTGALIFAASEGCRRDDRPSIVLIVVDTLRADRVTADHGSEPLMPHVRQLAKEAAVYDEATSAAPMTMPSVAALLTGLYPDHTGVVTHDRGVSLGVASPTLAEIMRAAGYSTAAVVANPWLASPATRFNRGFETFTTKRSLALGKDRLDAKTVTDLAIDAVQRTDRPAFLWVHYIDTHMPYQPPQADAAALGNASASSAIVRDYTRPGFDRQSIYFTPHYPFDEIDATRTLYDAAARAVDHEIGRLLEAIESTLGPNTIVIFTADHGESLGEHGLYFAHDFTLYRELTHVPLIVRMPGAERTHVRTPVSLVSVTPTICRLAKIECPDGLDGMPLPASNVAQDDGVFSVGPPFRERYEKNPFVTVRGLEGRWTALRRDDRALIRVPTKHGVRWEAYDLAADPAETHDVFDAERDAPLVQEIDDWRRSLTEAVKESGPRVSRKFRHDEIKDLRALGYLD